MRMETGVRVNATTLNVICDACTESLRLKEGIQIHGLVLLNGFEADLFLGNSIINMYSGVGLMSDPFTCRSVLNASAGLAVLNRGVQIHAHVVKLSLETDLSVQNALLSMYAKCGNLSAAHLVFSDIRGKNLVSMNAMYAKCGNLSEAHLVFSNIGGKNLVSMNAMITAFAHHGFTNEALKLFKDMRSGCHEPNCVTSLGVLSACVHVELVEEGLHYFAMMRCYQNEPSRDHYASGRSPWSGGKYKRGNSVDKFHAIYT